MRDIMSAGWHAETYGSRHLLVTIIKDGPLEPVELFNLRDLVPDDGYEAAIDRVIADPSLASRPFGYVTLPGEIDVWVQFVDVVDGLEHVLLHSDYDLKGSPIDVAPDYVLAVAPMVEGIETPVFETACLYGTCYVEFRHGLVTRNVPIRGFHE